MTDASCSHSPRRADPRDDRASHPPPPAPTMTPRKKLARTRFIMYCRQHQQTPIGRTYCHDKYIPVASFLTNAPRQPAHQHHAHLGWH
eukprot:3908542-Pyramimonas_sp.AAC.2